MASNVLVVFYSRSGTTARVANSIATILDADVERIQDPARREGVGGYARSLLEAVAKGLPTIRTRREPRDYELVVLGTPVWASTMASPMRAYLAAQRGRLTRIACFAVMAGSGGEDVVHEMRLACSALDAPSLVLRASDIKSNRYEAKCGSFADAVRARLMGAASSHVNAA